MSAVARGNAARVAVSSRFAAAPLRCAPSGDTATRAAKSVPVAGSRLPATSDPQSTPRIDARADSNYRHQLDGIPDPEPRAQKPTLSGSFPYWNGLTSPRTSNGVPCVDLARGGRHLALQRVRRVAGRRFGFGNPSISDTVLQHECVRGPCASNGAVEGKMPSLPARPAWWKELVRRFPTRARPTWPRARTSHRALGCR